MSPQPATQEAEAEPAWSDFLAEFDAQRQTTKLVHFPVNPNLTLTFRIRQLTQEEADEVEEAGVNVKSGRRESKVEVTPGAAKALRIQHGVVEGPRGWTGNERDIRALPDWIRDELSDSILRFHTLEEETRVGFFQARKG